LIINHIKDKKLKLNWFAVQPTSYNYYFYSAIKQSDKLDISVFYSLKEFSQLPYKEKFYDSEDYFFLEDLLIDFNIIRRTFSRNTFIVYAGWDGKTKLLSIFLRSLLNLPFAIWTDSINPDQYQKNTITKYLKILFFKKAKVIFTTGLMGINSLKKILNSECHNKIVNLPYFSKIPRLYKSAMEKSDKDKFNILVLSRLVDYKGVDIVVEAVKKLNSQNVKLYIGGVGELAETLKRKSLELNIQDQVVFCGFLNENEMIELQNKCHVFVHAAKKHEPYGLVVIDNLSMGIPVIATNVTGAAIDRIKDGFNGFIIEPNDVNSLVHKLEYLMKNQTMLIEMSANARVGAEQWTAERGVSIIENSLINSL